MMVMSVIAVSVQRAVVVRSRMGNVMSRGGIGVCLHQRCHAGLGFQARRGIADGKGCGRCEDA